MTPSRDRRPLLFLGIDASARPLVERWTRDGTLPALQALRARGGFGRIRSTADYLVGSPWPTMLTSTWPSEHGFLNFLIWRPELMKDQRPHPDWRPIAPFYRRLGRAGRRVVAVDVPNAYPAEPMDGLEITSWGAHDKLWPVSAHPPEILRWMKTTWGRAPMDLETAGLQRVDTLLDLRDRLLRCAEEVGDLARRLMARERWDLFMVVFGSAHRAGHKFWDLTGVLGEPGTEEVEEFQEALREVYRAVDAEIGRIVEAAGDATILCGSLHGMGPNHSRFCILPEMVDRIAHDRRVDEVEGPPAEESTLVRLRGAVPLEWRSAVKRRLPQRMQDWLTRFWRRGWYGDFSRTRVFVTMGDLEGYIRLNLRGRERDGIVDAGEAEALLETLEEGLRSWEDARTGDPVVDEVVRGADLYPARDPEVDMPDLIVTWRRTPAHETTHVRSERYGTIAWPTPGKIPDGRSGHHRAGGWLIAVGEHIEPGSELPDTHVIDLAPTILELLGVEALPEMRGTAVRSITGGRPFAPGDGGGR